MKTKLFREICHEIFMQILVWQNDFLSHTIEIRLKTGCIVEAAKVHLFKKVTSPIFSPKMISKIVIYKLCKLCSLP